MIEKQKGFGRTVPRKAVIIAVVDILSICTAFFAALWLRFDFQFNAIHPEYLKTYAQIILPWCGISVMVFALLGLYTAFGASSARTSWFG